MDTLGHASVLFCGLLTSAVGTEAKSEVPGIPIDRSCKFVSCLATSLVPLLLALVTMFNDWKGILGFYLGGLLQGSMIHRVYALSKSQIDGNEGCKRGHA